MRLARLRSMAQNLVIRVRNHLECFDFRLVRNSYPRISACHLLASVYHHSLSFHSHPPTELSWANCALSLTHLLWGWFTQEICTVANPMPMPVLKDGGDCYCQWSALHKFYTHTFVLDFDCAQILVKKNHQWVIKICAMQT